MLQRAFTFDGSSLTASPQKKTAAACCLSECSATPLLYKARMLRLSYSSTRSKHSTALRYSPVRSYRNPMFRWASVQRGSTCRAFLYSGRTSFEGSPA